MNINYEDTKKDLPCEQLHHMFVSVGWSDGSETPEMVEKGYGIPWLNSSLVVSAWENEKLIGAVRVLSDTMFRSVIYDLLVLPKYQNKGIGKELVRRCIEHYRDSEWLVETTESISRFYEKFGFKRTAGNGERVFLSIPCKLFSV